MLLKHKRCVPSPCARLCRLGSGVNNFLVLGSRATGKLISAPWGCPSHGGCPAPALPPLWQVWLGVSCVAQLLIKMGRGEKCCCTAHFICTRRDAMCNRLPCCRIGPSRTERLGRWERRGWAVPWCFAASAFS